MWWWNIGMHSVYLCLLAFSCVLLVVFFFFFFNDREGYFKVRRQFKKCYGHENAWSHSQIPLCNRQQWSSWLGPGWGTNLSNSPKAMHLTVPEPSRKPKSLTLQLLPCRNPCLCEHWRQVGITWNGLWKHEANKLAWDWQWICVV